MTITRMFPAALAILALAAPAAWAKPDTGSPVVKANSSQDLRSPDARDAASPVTAPVQDLRSPDARDAATPLTAHRDLRPIVPVPPAREPIGVAADGDDGGIAWTTIGLGLVPSVLVAGGLAALLARRSRQTQRVGAST